MRRWLVLLGTLLATPAFGQAPTVIVHADAVGYVWHGAPRAYTHRVLFGARWRPCVGSHVCWQVGAMLAQDDPLQISRLDGTGTLFHGAIGPEVRLGPVWGLASIGQTALHLEGATGYYRFVAVGVRGAGATLEVIVATFDVGTEGGNGTLLGTKDIVLRWGPAMLTHTRNNPAQRPYAFWTPELEWRRGLLLVAAGWRSVQAVRAPSSIGVVAEPRMVAMPYLGVGLRFAFAR